MFTFLADRGTSQPQVRSLRPDRGPIAYLCGHHVCVHYTV